MPERLRGYRFHPLERRGVALGLGASELAVLGAGVLVALAALRLSGAGGLVAAVAALGASLAAACWPVAGRSAVGWAPVAGRWLAVRRRAVRVAPAGAAAPPAGVRLVEARRGPGDERLGVVWDQRRGVWSAVLPVASSAFTLLDGDEKRRRLAAWGAVLASTARAGSPIHRLQWIERTVERDARGPAARFDEVVTAGVPDACVAGYRELVGASTSGGRDHEVLVVLSVRPRRSGRQARAFGRGGDGACGLLRRELRLLRGQLRNAEVEPGWPLDLPGLATAVRAGVDGGERHRRAAGHAGAWPLGWRDTWASVRVDDHWHATYWIAEWPRRDVGPDFLAPLLLVPAARAVAVTMAPVPPHQAAREAESARTAEIADDELRRRAGFLQTARHRRRAEGVINREAELADGHAELRFSGYVTVSGASPEELDAGCAAVETAGHQAGMEMRRLYGQQVDAFTWTLPIGRGLS
jgi:hypothetical protein